MLKGKPGEIDQIMYLALIVVLLVTFFFFARSGVVIGGY